MTITKRIVYIVIILITLLGLFFIYNYFTQPVVKAPTEIPANNDFKGPSGPPSIKGPSGPPPQY